MSKKTILFGLVGILLASLVGGAFAVPAQAAVYYPGLYCSPSVQSATSGQWVSFFAGYNHAPSVNGSLTWTAVGGYPQTGVGSTFGTQFYTSSINETRVISVTDGYSTATCVVYVNGPVNTWTPVPTPWSGQLNCSPSFSNVNSGERVRFNVTGGNGSYSWSALEGSPSSDAGSSFATRFYNNTGMVRDYWVTVTSNAPYNWQTASCQVRVSPSYSTPTPATTPSFSLSHEVRNVSTGDDGSSVTARNGDRLQFTTNIKMGDEYAQGVHIRDWLPQYVNYVYGSTTVEGVSYQDGIATGHTNDSLALGTLSPNRTYTVRFDALVSGAPRMTLTNSVNVSAHYAATKNRTSTVKVITSSVPTPTVTPTWTPNPSQYPSNSTLALSITGRNRTRGQSTETSSVHARGNETVEIVLNVRNSGAGYLTNVMVTNYLPAGVRYAPSTTTINGYGTGDGITSSGINIGSLTSGQTSVVKFSVVVEAGSVPTMGQVTISNTAQVRADGSNSVSSTLKLTLGHYLALAGAGVQTGPADSLLLALAVATLSTGLYAAYTRTARFGRRMTATEIARISGATPNFVR